MTEAMELCGCSEEYGPCERHCDVVVQREGAGLYTADELNVLFLRDAQQLVPDALSPYGKDVLLRVGANLVERGSSWISEDPNLADELGSLVDQVENNIGTADFQTYREDGYRIVKITGGPFAELGD